jgi:hypothetical protein
MNAGVALDGGEYQLHAPVVLPPKKEPPWLVEPKSRPLMLWTKQKKKTHDPAGNRIISGTISEL